MALNASEVKGNSNNNRVEQPILDAGTYPARVVQIVDLGLQAQRPYQGKEKPPANEIMLTYELSDEFMVDEDGKELPDKPRWVSEIIPLHSLKAEGAKSTKRYLALDPKQDFGGDFSQCAGIPTNVTLVNNQVGEKNYTNVVGITAMRAKDAQKAPELINPSKVFDLDKPDMTVFGSLPEWVQDKIKKNLNFQGSPLQQLLGGKAPEEKKQPKEEGPEEGEENDGVPW